MLDEHVYVDDGISGAEFATRPGFLRLMAALKPRPPFQALIMSEESRLGREAIETAFALKQIIIAGVRVFLYLEDRERELNSPMEKAMLSLQTMADEMEREKARLRVTDAMMRKARAGYACGAPCFGYDNVPVLDAAGRRSHVERRINDLEAAIVRRMFDLSANGYGYARIAKLLNTEGAPRPRPKPGRPSGWAPSSVKEILDRRLYLGELVWNRTRKRDAWGQVRFAARPDREWIRVNAPDLRIVTDVQWTAAHSRLTQVRARMAETGAGFPVNRVVRDLDSKYLLTGFARCAVCGGGFGVLSDSYRSDRRHVYGCLTYHKRGTAACGNQLRLPLEPIDQAVLRTLGGDVLKPAVVSAVIDGVLRAVTPSTAELPALRTSLASVERGLGNLAEAIATTGELAPLLRELQSVTAKRDDLVARIAGLERFNLQRIDRKALDARVREHLTRWRSLLSVDHLEDGRRLLREVLAGPLRFTPDGRSYRFEGAASFGGIVAGMADVATLMVAVRGFEPRSRG